MQTTTIYFTNILVQIVKYFLEQAHSNFLLFLKETALRALQRGSYVYEKIEKKFGIQFGTTLHILVTRPM